MPPRGPSGIFVRMKTILAALDFSAISRRVVAEARAAARQCKARIVFCHVVPYPVELAGYDVIIPSSPKVIDAVMRKAARNLDACVKLFRSRGIAAKAVLRTGEASREILSAAKYEKADYILIGSHGHGAVFQLFAGSTASRVLHGSRCPVIVVPRGAR